MKEACWDNSIGGSHRPTSRPSTKKNQEQCWNSQYLLCRQQKHSKENALVGAFPLSLVLFDYPLRDLTKQQYVFDLTKNSCYFGGEWWVGCGRKRKKKRKKNIVLWWINGHSHCFQAPTTFRTPRRRHTRPLGTTGHCCTSQMNKERNAKGKRIKKELKKNVLLHPVPFDGVAKTSIFTQLLDWFIENTYSF